MLHLAGGKAVTLEACDHRITALDKDGALATDAADAEGHVGALFHAFQTDALRQGVAKVCAGLHGQHTPRGHRAVLDIVGSGCAGQLALAGGRVRQGPIRVQMKRIDPGIMIVGEELVLAKYDTDKDGKLSDEEIAVLQADVKKAQEAKKAAILKKFDKDGDGKLSKEERKAMQEEWHKDHPEAAKRMEEMKARQEAHAAAMIKKFDKDGDGKLSPEELQSIPPHHGQPGPHHAVPGGPKGPRMPNMDGPRRPGGPRAEGPRAPRGPEGRRGGEGRREDGNRGPHGNRPNGPRPQLDPNRAPIMAAGWILIEEKYDADKDGKLNEAEMAQLNADASKALEARREARKAARGNNDMPAPPGPAQGEGADEKTPPRTNIAGNQRYGPVCLTAGGVFLCLK